MRVLCGRLGETAALFGHSLHLSFYAEACLRTERLDEGLAAVDAGLAHCRNTGERLFEPELRRLRGEVLARRGRVRGQVRAAGSGDAEACFDTARALDRAHGTSMLERRAGGLPALVRKRLSAGARGARRATPS